MTRDEVVEELRKAVGRGYGAQRIFAERCGCPPCKLSEALGGKRPPSRAMLKAIGIRKVVSYERI